MVEKINNIRKVLKEKNPIIHSITNPISINQCANAIIAIGAKPIMAEHPKEVEEITKTAGALMLNLGNITDIRMDSMRIASKTAYQNKIPYVLDAVGIACSKLRKQYAFDLLKDYSPTMVKGNYSEINALYYLDYTSKGVDTDLSLDTQSIAKISIKLANKYNTIILASGKIDIITDGKKLIYIKNGTPQLGCVTGTGCMLGALCASYLSVCQEIDAVVTGCVVLGIAGQKSKTDKGNGTFMVNLMDNISVISDEDIKKYIDMEEVRIEEI